MPKQVFQASDGTVFNSFEEANAYEVTQEMETLERLGLDGFLQEVADDKGDNSEEYHETRMFLSDLLRWCSNNDRKLEIYKLDDPLIDQGQLYQAEDTRQVPTTGAERGFPNIDVPPGIKVDPTKPVPYEPPPAEGICARR